MGLGQKDEENPPSDDEARAEREKLNPNPMEEGIELKKIPIKTTDAGYPEVIIGHSDPLIKPHHLKFLLIGFNGFLTVLGVVLLSLSIWIRVDPDFWEYETNLEVGNFHAVCAMFIVASVVIIVLGFVGCLGAAGERRWLLLIFMGILGVLFLLELAAVIMLWIAPYSATIAQKVDKKLLNQIDSRSYDDSSRYFLDYIQSHLECCGSTSVRDYKGVETPTSCQDILSGKVFPYGCSTKILAYLRVKAGVIGGIALPILLIQVFALMAAGFLIKGLKRESGYFM